MNAHVFVHGVLAEEGREPAVPSASLSCAECGRPMWVEHELLATIERIHPSAPVSPLCPQCAKPGPYTVLPEQIALALAHGCEPGRLIVVLALLSVRRDGRSLSELQEQIKADPTGRLAAEYREQHQRAAIRVEAIRRRN